MNSTVKVALAQIDLAVGDIAGNTAKIIQHATRARDEMRADLVVFPELSVCGYPPEDLLFHAGLRKRTEQAVAEIREAVSGIAILIGFPEYVDDRIYNSCGVFSDGEILGGYRKQLLPNYRVFDEERYFTAGKDAGVFRLNGIGFGMTICEDVWRPGPIAAARTAGAECIITINGSPFEVGTQLRREETLQARVAEAGIPVLYLNMVGGQDELVFDGGTVVMDADGEVRFRAPSFEEGLHELTLTATASGIDPGRAPVTQHLGAEESVYRALVTGTRDYVEKHGFPGVVIGLSGGIDSALVLSIACDAIGADRVRAVMMPFRYTSTMSQEDAARQAAAMGIRYDVIPIAPIYEAAVGQLEIIFEGREQDVTEENIQARSRGLLLMALARYRNSVSEIIPDRVITRPPSAELRADQKDSDSLPDYDVLDPILEAFIEDDLSVEQITARGFDKATVVRILEMVKRNEYKRRQAPPGIRISSRAFGRDWRYPITSGYKFPG
jgi:NAD+ synthase (glutamine-hydrolysing)